MSDPSSLAKIIFGRLTLDAIPYHEPILIGTFVMVAIGGAAVFGLITWYKLWGMLWRDWFTSVDHKKIGVMYIVLGLIMLLRGFRRCADDARAAGDGVRLQSGLPAVAPL